MSITSAREHACRDGIPSQEPSYWLKDAQGIELCRACEYCENDVDEPIEPEESWEP